MGVVGVDCQRFAAVHDNVEAVGRAEGVVGLTGRYMGRSHNFQSSILIERSGKIVRTVQK